MATFLDITNAIVDIHQSIDDFITSGIYQFFTKWFAEFIKWTMVVWFKFKLQAITFAYDVAQELLASFDMSSGIEAALASLDSKVLQLMLFFRIPEAFNLILSAYTTRLVLSFMGM